MKLTKKQKEALEEAPLYFGQSESNLNHFYWTNGKNNKWFQPRTIDKLKKLGLLAPKYNKHEFYSEDVLYRVD